MTDRSAYSILESEPRERSFTSDEIPHNPASASAWTLLLSSLISAAFAAILLAQLPRPASLLEALLIALISIATTVAAGIGGVWGAWLLLPAKPALDPAVLCAKLTLGLVFLPSLARLSLANSPWLLPIAAVATLALALPLRELFHPSSLAVADQPTLESTATLPSLYGLPPTNTHLLQAVAIALSVQAAIFFAIVGVSLLAAPLLCIALLLATARWSALERRLAPRVAISPADPENSAIQPPPTSIRIFFSLTALLITILTLLPHLILPPEQNPIFTASTHSPTKPVPQAEPDSPASDYVGIILWPPPVKKTAILPPIQHPHTLGPGRLAQPIVIPFDGPYWYFKSPAKAPGLHAHIAHGQPTDSNVRSSDRDPLFMQAHQNLGTPIDLNCCAEIDLALTNADIRPGAIQLGILLSDSTTPGKPTLYLGAKVVPSSTAQTISLTRSPVKEILHFPITASSKLTRFDEITVVYLPSWERDLAGAKLSLQSFTLIPR